MNLFKNFKFAPTYAELEQHATNLGLDLEATEYALAVLENAYISLHQRLDASEAEVEMLTDKLDALLEKFDDQENVRENLRLGIAYTAAALRELNSDDLL